MNRAQIVKCQHGKVFAACMEPQCYTDKDWMRDVRKYANGSCTVHIVESQSFKFEKCDCDKYRKEPVNMPVALDPNQLELFKL